MIHFKSEVIDNGTNNLNSSASHDEETKETQLAHERAMRNARVRGKCIRKEHYPPETVKTSMQRDADAETYAANVTETTWDHDLSKFLRYGSPAEVLHEIGFYQIGLARQKTWVYLHQRKTECARMDCEFEEEVSAKIQAMEKEWNARH